ncbi:Hypothetical predicted protein, partial [Drosophila guanche]
SMLLPPNPALFQSFPFPFPNPQSPFPIPRAHCLTISYFVCLFVCLFVRLFVGCFQTFSCLWFLISVSPVFPSFPFPVSVSRFPFHVYVCYLPPSSRICWASEWERARERYLLLHACTVREHPEEKWSASERERECECEKAIPNTNKHLSPLPSPPYLLPVDRGPDTHPVPHSKARNQKIRAESRNIVHTAEPFLIHQKNKKDKITHLNHHTTLFTTVPRFPSSFL